MDIESRNIPFYTLMSGIIPGLTSLSLLLYSQYSLTPLEGDNNAVAAKNIFKYAIITLIFALFFVILSILIIYFIGDMRNIKISLTLMFIGCMTIFVSGMLTMSAIIHLDVEDYQPVYIAGAFSVLMAIFMTCWSAFNLLIFKKMDSKYKLSQSFLHDKNNISDGY